MRRTTIIFCAALGCYGGVGASGDDDDDSAGPGDDSGSTDPSDDAGDDDAGEPVDPDAAPAFTARRLTKEQYGFTIADVLGVELGAELDRLPDETRTDGFTNSGIGLVVAIEHVEAWLELAEIVVAAMPDLPGFVATHAPCQEFASECERGFVESAGQLLFRRPLVEREIEMFAGPFAGAATESMSFTDGAGLALQAMLQSPQFLYQLEDESVADDGIRRVAPHELATRMSYFLWQSAPDDELLAAAADHRLGTAEELVAQAERMVAIADRAPRTTSRFVRDWFALDALADTSRVDLDSETAKVLLASVVATYDAHTLAEEAPLTELFTRERLSVGPTEAQWFGKSPSGDGIAEYDLADVPERIGVLTMPGVLTAMSDRDVGGIVARGLFVLEHVLCAQPLSPPPDLDLDDFDDHLGPEATERDYSEDRLAQAQCGACHQQFDPLAHALEPFDGIGRWATENELGSPLRQDGSARLPDGTELAFTTVEEYVVALSQSPMVQRCVVEKHLQFALGRRLDPGQSFVVDEIAARHAELGGSYRALVVAIVEHDVFRTARVE